ncbi:MAG: DUF3575 domain-containing protein [Chitinophagaceae bacterium]
MKKIKLFIIPLIILSMQTNLQAQRVKEGGSSDGPEKKNCVKINLSSLAYKNIALQYERAIGNKISAAVQLRFMPKGKPFGLTQISDDPDLQNLYDSYKVGSFAITPEFRFYPKQALKGFYLAPYLRFRNISMNLPIEYTDDNSIQQNVTSTGSFTSFGGGLMIGSHFNLGSRMSLDIFWLGIQYMLTNGTLKATSSKALSLTEQADLNSSLNDFKTEAEQIIKDVTYSVNSNGFTLNGKWGSPGIRAIGINLGVRF